MKIRLGDAAENFRTFRETAGAYLAGRQVGNAADIAVAHGNAVCAEDFVAKIATKIEALGGRVGTRADAAGRNVIAASLMTRAALLSHLRQDEHFEIATWALLRSSIELAARAVYIARGVHR